MDKTYVFDKPLVKTQRFEVSIPNQTGRITVIKKEVIRKIHHMGCTDGLTEDYTQNDVDYEIYREVDIDSRKKAIESVELEVEKMREATIRMLCEKKNMKDCEVFVKFFMRRFPDESDRIHSYCNEWIDRFMSGNPDVYMDKESKKIYEEVTQ